MADKVEVTKKEWEELKKEVENLKKEKEARDRTEVDNLDEYLAGKEKLLEIELAIAKATGDTRGAMETAKSVSALWSQSQQGAFERGSAAAEEFANQLGISQEEVERLIDLHDELGEVGLSAYDQMKGGAEDVAVKFGLVSKKADGIMGGIIKFGKLASSPQGIKGMAIALKDTFKPARIAASLLLKIAEQTVMAFLAADKATAGFAKMTGAGRAMTEQINATGLAHRNLGISIEDSGKAYTNLFNTVGGFTEMTQKAQDRMAVTAAAFEKFGLGGETAGQMIEDFRKRLGATADEAVDMTNDLALAAKGLGVSMSKFVKGFQSANKVLAVYGKKGVKVYKKIAAAARAAGVETESLLGLAGKFDTFSDAAETTGKLNAILGTQMSAMDLLAMKEDERIEYLIRNMQATGKSFKHMDKFTQKSIANAAGITDMAEANKIFGMSMGQYKKHQRDMAAQAKSQEEMNERMKEAQTVVDQLKMIMANFAISMAPMVDDIKGIVQALADFMQNGFAAKKSMVGLLATLVLFSPVLGPLVMMMMPILGLLGKMIGATWGLVFAKKKKLAADKLDQMSEQMNIMQQQQKIMSDNAQIQSENMKQMAQKKGIVIQQTTNNTVARGVGPMLALGAAILMIGVGIGIAALGMAEFVKAFGSLNVSQMWGATLAMVAFTGAMYLFMSSLLGLSIAAPVAQAIGVAVLMMGVGMGLAALGVAAIVEQLVALSSHGWNAIAVVWGLVGATYGLAAAAAAMANPFTMIGMALLMGVLYELSAMAEAQARMAEATSSSISEMSDMANQLEGSIAQFESIANANFLGTFTSLYLGIRAFMSAMDLDSEHGVKIQHTLENLALIATGKAAPSIDGGLGSAIVGAINRIAGGDDAGKQTIRLEIDHDGLKKLMEDGYYELEAS